MKIQKRKISKESVKISSWRSFENEEFKKVKKSEKIEFKKNNLKTLRGLKNVMIKILQKKI